MFKAVCECGREINMEMQSEEHWMNNGGLWIRCSQCKHINWAE